METTSKGPGGDGPWAITADGVRRTYSSGEGGGFEAVRGVGLRVGRGEMFALLGTNGAGKTSLVELLEGLARPSAGTIKVLGHDPYAERTVVRPRIGVLLQSGGFPGDLTVAETARTWAGATTGARPPGEVLELLGLGGRLDVRVKQLSGGEARRLDLAIALLGRPEVLFLDEPTTGMDPEGRRDTWRLVKQLQEEGTTVLLTTHYLEEAEALADRLAIIHEGRAIASGTPAEVIADHPSRIRFSLADGPVDLPHLGAGTRAKWTGRLCTVRTAHLQPALYALLSWAEERGAELEGLDARAASLEEVFLGLSESTTDDVAMEVAS
ncbi:ABC transporter ATP-binding protein [Actinocorallia populi]|uniref:ABC transporter ATP-binding protein n=1 Tax=Actinocorallia populi TaxID=2079200 RepID=UPI000D08BAFD|nr:ABC transporter ATP-binding protein [Actinocorallia populi]